MIDAAIVMIRTHKHLERAPEKPRTMLIEAASEVGPALSFSLLIITVSSPPIYHGGAGGRLFSPLATKTCDGCGGDPVGNAGAGPDGVVPIPDHSRHKNPINRFLTWAHWLMGSCSGPRC